MRKISVIDKQYICGNFYIDESIEETFFPWEYIKPWTTNEISVDKIDLTKKCYINCNCGTLSKDLYYINFITPEYTWYQLCGRSGTLGLCKSCGRQVCFECEFMS